MRLYNRLMADVLRGGEGYLHMPTQGWAQALTTQRTAGTLQNTFTTAKSVINAQDLYPFYSNYFQLGTKLRIRVNGAISNIVTTPGTIVFQVLLGSVIAWSSGNVQLNATAHTLMPFQLDIDLTCQLTNTASAGAVAKLMGQGRLTGIMFTLTAGQTDSAQGDQTIMVPHSTPALGTAFDSTVSQQLDFWAGFSISNAGNGIRVDQLEYESWNMPAS